ncbi:MAG: TonB-dependent receptor plug domain-containing protein [Cytophagales bacterium]
MRQYLKILFLLLIPISLKSQKVLDEVVINSGRILIPFSDENRNLIIIDSIFLNNSSAKNLSEILQQVIGVDIRRRGNDDIQSDLYIRGGSFDQTLLLINGIKVEDSQTGHHQMNLSVPIDLIDKIEILKGPGSRIFGMNAFNGAVNIITKKNSENGYINLDYGSFKTFQASGSIPINTKKTSHILSSTYRQSDGYRYNTDYNYFNLFYSGIIEINDSDLEILFSNSDRKFGANGFYASPEARDQYEETNGSLLNFKLRKKRENISIESSLYWRRHEDTYIYIRDNPSVYKNDHISHKLGFQNNISIFSDIGITGIGIDLSNTWLSSNNLGERNRFITTIFAEQLINKNKFSFTPGIAFSIYEKPSNDLFKSKLFPGIDIGYKLSNKISLNANIGETFRIPTFTDLYYSDPNNQGNENLDPEKAFTSEVGFKLREKNYGISLSLFRRKSDDLIDYVKANPDDKWSPQNIRNVITTGIEFDSKLILNNNNSLNTINLGYAYINDNYENDILSRYSLNSYRHRLILNFDFKLTKSISNYLSYRYGIREIQDGNSKSVIDYKIMMQRDRWKVTLNLNNIFDSKYYETNLVQMPGRNITVGLNIEI